MRLLVSLLLVVLQWRLCVSQTDYCSPTGLGGALRLIRGDDPFEVFLGAPQPLCIGCLFTADDGISQTLRPGTTFSIDRGDGSVSVTNDTEGVTLFPNATFFVENATAFFDVDDNFQCSFDDETHSAAIVELIFNPPTLDPSDTVDITEGEDLMLSCDDPGNSNAGSANYQWFNDSSGEAVTDDDDTTPPVVYTVTDIQREASGNYSCVLTDDDIIDFEPFSTVVVNVQYPPVIFSIDATSTVLDRGDTLSIECTFEGNPDPTVDWVLADAGTINGDITTNATTSILTLTNVQPDDSGSYECVANNSVGQDSKNITITVIAPTPSSETGSTATSSTIATTVIVTSSSTPTGTSNLAVAVAVPVVIVVLLCCMVLMAIPVVIYVCRGNKAMKNDEQFTRAENGQPKSASYSKFPDTNNIEMRAVPGEHEKSDVTENRQSEETPADDKSDVILESSGVTSSEEKPADDKSDVTLESSGVTSSEEKPADGHDYESSDSDSTHSVAGSPPESQDDISNQSLDNGSSQGTGEEQESAEEKEAIETGEQYHDEVNGEPKDDSCDSQDQESDTAPDTSSEASQKIPDTGSQVAEDHEEPQMEGTGDSDSGENHSNNTGDYQDCEEDSSQKAGNDDGGNGEETNPDNTDNTVNSVTKL